MAWTYISNAIGWDALIAGVRWYRDHANDGYTYSFLIEDRDALPAVNGLSEAEGDIYPAAHWRAVAFQAIWQEELAAEEEALAAQAQQQAPPGNQPAQQPVDEAEVEAEADDEEVIAARLADPVVTSKGAAEYTGRGAFVWLAGFSVTQGQQVKSWIIQKLTVNDNGQAGSFFEAFPVLANQTTAAEEDTYQSSSQSNSGKFVVTGVARHYVFTGGADPPGFTFGAGMADDEQLACENTPEWWEGNDGTAHNLDFKWGAFACTLTTVPPSGDPVKKNGLSDLRSG